MLSMRAKSITMNSLYILAVLTVFSRSLNAFQSLSLSSFCRLRCVTCSARSQITTTKLYMSSDNEGNGGFTRRQILKEETEAPFRKIRYFLYLSLTLSAALATLITGTSILAVNGGLREGNLTELYQNLGINLAGLPVIAYFWRRDVMSQNALLERIEKGGSLARLKLKLKKGLRRRDGSETF